MYTLSCVGNAGSHPLHAMKSLCDHPGRLSGEMAKSLKSKGSHKKQGGTADFPSLTVPASEEVPEESILHSLQSAGSFLLEKSMPEGRKEYV